MSSADRPSYQPTYRGPFLVALLRAGAPVIAEVPADLPDEAVDPAPIPGWQRISMLAGSHGTGAVDALLMRACRYIVLVPLLYRIVGIPVLFVPVVLADRAAGAVPGGVLAACGVAANVVALALVLRVRGFHSALAKGLLAGDLVAAAVLNLAAALWVTGAGYPAVSQMTWEYVIGSVALLTLTRGVPAGVALVVAAVPFQLLLTRVGGQRGVPLADLLADVLTLLPALVTAMVVLILIGLAARLAMGVGIRRGERAEHANAQRTLHDTVLQTLEALALPPVPPTDLDGALAQLAELRGIARAQALQLRSGLAAASSMQAETVPSGIGEEIAALAAEMAREGLRAQLVFTEVDDASLSEARRWAVRDAVREAMRNTMKHAGTAEVVVRVEQRDGGIAVITRDHGTGFAAADAPAGFGISNSITARLADVGGSSTIESEPGKGTRVTLWVPL